MKKVAKKLTGMLLALVMAVTTVLCSATPVQAASSVNKTQTVLTTGCTVTGGEESAVSFTLEANSGFGIYMLVPSPVAVQVTLYDSTGEPLANSRMATAADYKEVVEDGVTYYGICDYYTQVPAGDYIYGFTFAQDTQVIIDIEQVTKAFIQSKATITAGFSKKLSVTGAKVKSWASRDKSIAVVDKNGKVTGKKKGKTKIIATLDTGEKLECTVTVANNQFSNAKVSVDDCTYGMWTSNGYYAAYDKKGNLVVKVQILNSTGYERMTQLKNVKLVVKDANGKVVGTYKQLKKAVSIGPQSSKVLTFTIKKANLKIKKAELRNGSVSFDADAYGR